MSRLSSMLFNVDSVRRACSAMLAVGALCVAGSALAAPVAFVPPNDPVGKVFTTNTNDGWGVGRGIGLQVTSAQTIHSVGVFQNLSNIQLNYGVYEISSSSGAFSKTATLRSGSSTVTTNGLEWIDFSFADLTLDVGKNYLIEFLFNGNSNQNFFYNNANQPWTQGAFQALEGTQSNNFNNFVVGAFRVDGGNAVPLPGTLPLLALALAGLIATRRRV